jgi:Tol biopolymer transport system component/predicted Ser/Thr protein kinase
MTLEIDSLLKDRYLIEKQLGKGGMGAVYLATDTAVERKVAVKVNLNPTDEAKRQFEREARMLAALRHPNLPLVTDHFVLADAQYLVMDYVPGDDLSGLLKSEGAQPLDKVLEWGKQLGDALTYLHKQMPAIIHRDIKPANIKITPDGQVVLVDFGIAKSSAGGHTTVGARGYTPRYAPPEQYGPTSTGPYSDQYSLAATLYALLLGTPPVESIDRMLDQATLASPRTLDKSIPRHVDAALKRALSIEPGQRFVSVDEFIKALTDPHFKPTPPPKVAPTLRSAPHAAGTAAAPKKRSPLVFIIPVALVGCIVIAGAIAYMTGFLDLGGLFPAAPLEPTDTRPVPIVVSDETPQPPVALPTGTPQPPTATPTNSPSPTPTQVGGGGRIAFVSNRDGTGFFQIFTMLPDGSDVVQLTFDPVHKSQPRWSPDGTKLLYVAEGGRGQYNTPLNLDIFVINADGTDPVNLTQTKGDDTDPAWSFDGAKIAFSSTRAGGSSRLFIMDADGSDPVDISIGYAVEYNPAWSPDGKWLAFASSIFNTLSIREVDKKGDAAQLFDIKIRLGQVISPAWSPDGLYIAYVRVQGGTKEIFLAVFEQRGEALLRLTTTSYNLDPAWSPDGKWLAFTTSRDGNFEIYTMDAGGRFQTNITDNEARDQEPSWQPLP